MIMATWYILNIPKQSPPGTCSCSVGKYECFEGDNEPRCAVEGMRRERNSVS